MKKISFQSNISKLDQRKLARDIREIIQESWGDFGLDYVRGHVLNSKYIVLALKNDRIIGFASVREIVYKKEPIYYLEFTAVRKSDQGKKLSKALNKKIFTKIMLGRLVKLRFSFETLTITPNPRVLGTLSRIATFIYPNPYIIPAEFSEKHYELSKNILDKLKEPYRELEKEGNVIEGFYDSVPHLIPEPDRVQNDKDHKINEFASHYIRFHEKRGRDFVVYNKFQLSDFLKRL